MCPQCQKPRPRAVCSRPVPSPQLTPGSTSIWGASIACADFSLRSVPFITATMKRAKSEAVVCRLAAAFPEPSGKLFSIAAPSVRCGTAWFAAKLSSHT